MEPIIVLSACVLVLTLYCVYNSLRIREVTRTHERVYQDLVVRQRVGALVQRADGSKERV